MTRRVLALDSEMILCKGDEETLAHVVVLDQKLDVVYESFVSIPVHNIVDLRSDVTGIKMKDLASGKPLETVRKEVMNLLNSSIVVGHSLIHDFDALNYYPDAKWVRDTQTFPDFQQATRCQAASLSHAAEKVLDYNLRAKRNQRGGVHCANEDATLAMRLYLSVAGKWEEMVKRGTYKYSLDTSRQSCARQALKKVLGTSSGRGHVRTQPPAKDDYPEEDIPHWYGAGGEGSDEYGYWVGEGEWQSYD